MISAVFFDFSGTLVSGDFDVPACRKAVASYLRAKGFPASDAAYARSSEAMVKVLLAARGRGLETPYEDFMRGVLGGLGIREDSLIRQIEQVEFDQYHWTPVHHAYKVLHELSKEYRLGVISNGMTDSAIRVLRKMRLLSLFETVIISRDVGFRKPHPIIFSHALGRLEVPASDSVLVGDNMEADALGARKVGMKAIWLSQMGESRPDLTADDPFFRQVPCLDEVPETVRRLASLKGCERDSEAKHHVPGICPELPLVNG